MFVRPLQQIFDRKFKTRGTLDLGLAPVGTVNSAKEQAKEV